MKEDAVGEVIDDRRNGGFSESREEKLALGQGEGETGGVVRLEKQLQMLGLGSAWASSSILS